jgi:hypothetical protein
MNDKVDYLLPDDRYNPAQPDWEKIQHYLNIDPTGPEGKAHERDAYMPEP